MTTEWRETKPCPRCGLPLSTEQPINAWIRRHEQLDSRQQCLCISDSDLWILRYGTRKHSGVDRDCMYLMLVEIKTHGADISDTQRDLLHIVNQVLRSKPWSEDRDAGRFLPGHQQNIRSHIVESWAARKKVQLMCYGVHKLQLSGADPDSSEHIRWDNKLIDVQTLLRLLRFELSPDSLRLMEDRSHKRVKPTTLFDINDGVA